MPDGAIEARSECDHIKRDRCLKFTTSYTKEPNNTPPAPHNGRRTTWPPPSQSELESQSPPSSYVDHRHPELPDYPLGSQTNMHSSFPQGRAGLVAWRRSRGGVGALGKAFYKGGFEQRMTKREASLILSLKYVFSPIPPPQLLPLPQ